MKTISQPNPKEYYDADGFYISPTAIIPAGIVQRAIIGMDEVRAGVYDTDVRPEQSVWNPGDDPRKLCKIEMPQVANRAIMELIKHPALGKLASEVSGARWVQAWWVQLLYKPPYDVHTHAETSIGWHQDRQYWDAWESDSELFTAWVALSDVTTRSGPMRFVRGSQKWGFLKQGDFWSQNHDRQREEISPPSGNRWIEVEAVLPPGGVSFHDDLTFHGSGPNLANEPRRSFAIHLRTENSSPRNGIIADLTAHIGGPSYCPVIYREP